MEQDPEGSGGPSRAGSCATVFLVALAILTITVLYVLWQIEESLRL